MSALALLADRLHDCASPRTSVGGFPANTGTTGSPLGPRKEASVPGNAGGSGRGGGAAALGAKVSVLQTQVHALRQVVLQEQAKTETAQVRFPLP